MDIIYDYIHFILHINIELPYLFQTYGFWIYGLVFLIVFLESGIVFAPFLPGESMLFALGAVTAAGNIEPHSMVILLVLAAISGGFVNYGLGHFVGNRLLRRLKSPVFKKGMYQTGEFYNKYGPMAVLIARLVPIIRTFVPFFAGMVRMRFDLFSLFNIIGGIIWISIFIYAGYFFGKIPLVQKHFSWIVIAIIIFSLVPISIEILKILRKKRNEPAV